MEIYLTGYAEKQIMVRKLDRDQVIAVALNPDQIVYAEDENPIAQSRIQFQSKEALLRVVLYDTVDTRRIITVYLMTRFSKY